VKLLSSYKILKTAVLKSPNNRKKIVELYVEPMLQCEVVNKL